MNQLTLFLDEEEDQTDEVLPREEEEERASFLQDEQACLDRYSDVGDMSYF